ncbi:permease [Dokdonia pacifica]|uniref:EamA domain-containing membrane protein RarD n=1 Tax=Dokdonia pacifica TaxID=1627892 RepID=A0A238WVH5_9FLAO|nr:DMT family transporter [Dokdonia pacifica]GGG24017.1 permease [Dokdonia pacifica]SNR49629.1 EamA domain-containing membrane protein RarD [Dokdonia pacifica]
MQNSTLKWIYLVVLSIIWGSSFILIKKGLVGLTPIQLGALRILFTAFFLLLIGWKSLRTIKKAEWKWIIISGVLGTGLPVFLFAYAETEIDSAIAAILNSSVPLLTLLLGLTLFGATFLKRQLLGVLVGLSGATALILIGASINPSQNYWYALLVISAGVMYAFNVNIIKKYMQDISAIAIATGNFIFLIPPALVLLVYSDFFNQELLRSQEVQLSLGYIVILALFGTAMAKVMFNKLVQISNPVFASSVTYLMPIISVMWGVLDDEKFTIWQFFASLVIIVGVYLVNKKTKTT